MIQYSGDGQCIIIAVGKEVETIPKELNANNQIKILTLTANLSAGLLIIVL